MPEGGPEFGLAGYKLASFMAQALPGAVTAPIASLLGAGLSQAMKGKRTIVERHQQRAKDGALSDVALHRAVQAAFHSYARYWVESFRLPSLSAEEVEDGFAFHGVDHVFNAIAKGKGVILALPHLGGWEWAGRWLTDQGLPITVVVEPLADKEIFEWFASFRRSLGMTVVPLGPEAGTASMRALKNNEVLCLMCDRDIGGGGGVDVEFFGETTRLPGGPATLALRVGAPLLPTAVYFRGRTGHLALVRPPWELERVGRLRDDVTRVTQALAHELEGLIRVAPEQWHLFQPNWPSDPGYGG